MTVDFQRFLKRRTDYPDPWQSVDSDDLSRGLFSDLSVEALAKMEALAKEEASAQEEGVPLAVANRVFGKDALTCPGVAQRRRKPIIACPPKPWRRGEELNEILVA